MTPSKPDPELAALGAAIGSEPWFEPIRDVWRGLVAGRQGPGFGPDIAALDAAARARGLRSGEGRELRFVDARELDAPVYEEHIAATGQVPTRSGGVGGLHDMLNALVWLAFPSTKARLNALQAEAIRRDGLGARRGRLRDAATLFDENGALFVTESQAAIEALRRRDWPALFVEGRASFGRGIAVRPFGHALMQKLLAPYKAVCAHAWIVRMPADAECGAIDRVLAGMLDADSLDSRRFAPLPVLGVPGWCAANASASFYDDPAVFRPGGRRA